MNLKNMELKKRTGPVNLNPGPLMESMEKMGFSVGLNG